MINGMGSESRSIRGIQAKSPLRLPFLIHTYNRRSEILTICSLVPLQSPAKGSKFLSRRTGAPIFNFRICGGRPGILIELKY